MKRRNTFTLLRIVVLVGGILIAAAGMNIESPLLINAGIIIAACGCLADGIGTLLFPHFSTITGDTGTGSGEHYYTYSGFSAVMWGICMLVIGAALLTFAVIRLVGAGPTAVAYLKQHPGIALLGTGLCLVSYSLHEVAGAREENRVSWKMLKSLPARIFFSLLILIGLAILLLGLVEMVSPSAYHELMQKCTPFFPIINPQSP